MSGSKPVQAAPVMPSRQAIRARYEAAETTNENAPLWRLTDYLSPKAANSFQVRRTLKIRSRYEVANNSYARGIVNTIASDLIGTGPRLQVRTKDPAVNRKVEAAWQLWSKAIGLTEKLQVMAKAKVVDGEAFGLLVTNPRLRQTTGGKVNVDDAVQLDLNVIESDQVTTPDPGFIDYFWVDGMVLDKTGNPVEYHVLRHHPGDLFVPQLNPLVYDKWPVRNVLHWFRKDRPGQVRGVPEITPSLDLFAQLRRYTKAVIAAAETAADVAAYLETQAPADGDTVEPEPFDQLEIDRGMMVTLPWGTKINQLKAEQPATTYEMFVRLILREICRCLGVPLNIALGDSSGFNYSSGRLDHLGYYKSNNIYRQHGEAIVLNKLLAAWLDEAVMIPGLLPDGLTYHDLPHEWFWDAVESIDPVKDATAIEIELRSGQRNLRGIYAERGEDWEEAMIQRGKEIALAKLLGIPVSAPVGQAVAGEPGAKPTPSKPPVKAAADLELVGEGV